ESAAALLAARLGAGRPLEPLKRLLLGRTEGNPFFLEESVRTLVETGVVVGERGSFRLAKALDTIQVPATVQAVLAARIDRLPPPIKHLLQSAAVIGKTVALTLLETVAETTALELRRGLAQLQAAEFLYETSLFPELEYTFKHALTLEVAYQSLLRERRRLLHTGALAALEARERGHAPESVEVLAHHAVRGEVWTSAASYLYRAGASPGPRHGALERAREAAARADAADLRTRSYARFIGAVACRDMGRFEEAVEEFDIGVKLFATAAEGHEPGLVYPIFVSLCGWRSEAEGALGRFDAALASATEALRMATEIRHASSLSIANAFLGYLKLLQGDLEAAVV